MWLASIRHNLRSLLRFSGRDAPHRFWPYAFTLFVISNIILSVALQRGMERMLRYAVTHPAQSRVALGTSTVQVSIAERPHEVQGVMMQIVAWAGISMVSFLLLSAAAVARRLHDRGKSGWWGAATAALGAVGMVGTGRTLLAPTGVPPGIFFAAFLVNAAYLVSAACLVVLLAGSGTEGPNEYGPGTPAD